MKYSEAKCYVNAKQVWKDIWTCTYFIISVLLLICLVANVSGDYFSNSRKPIIVRDTIYLKQECKINGPDGYVDYVSEQHPIVYRIQGVGKYTFTITNP